MTGRYLFFRCHFLHNLTKSSIFPSKEFQFNLLIFRIFIFLFLGTVFSLSKEKYGNITTNILFVTLLSLTKGWEHRNGNTRLKIVTSATGPQAPQNEVVDFQISTHTFCHIKKLQTKAARGCRAACLLFFYRLLLVFWELHRGP